MKKLLIILAVFLSLNGFGQQVIRGYTASYAYGLLSVGDDFSIHYRGEDYTANARSGSGGCISLGFPFDVGFNRSRFVLTPGIDFLTTTYKLDLDKDLPLFGSDSDSLRLSSFMVTPQVGVMYKYHFYVKGLHFSLGAGADFKLPVSNAISLTDKNKTDLFEYDANPATGSDHMVFNNNTVYDNMANLGFHIAPRIGLDIYVTKYLATNIFYMSTPLTTFTQDPVLRGYGGAGATYLIPITKEDESRVLQYYKQ